MASYLDARASGAAWHVRIENIDPPREVPGAADTIVRSLEAHGFEWDGPLLWQADSAEAHDAALERLIEDEMAYRCGCSRRDLADQPTGPLGVIYPGTCRDGTEASEYAWRVRTDDDPVSFVDEFQGTRTHRLESESGDFVVKRRDGLVAYQLAVVVDDQLEGITKVVRGIDLIDSTFRQIWLQRLLGFPSPDYAHIPVAVHADGAKLSKLTGASGLDDRLAASNLHRALRALGQRPDPDLASASTSELWASAIANWNPSVLSGKTRVSPELELA